METCVPLPLNDNIDDKMPVLLGDSASHGASHGAQVIVCVIRMALTRNADIGQAVQEDVAESAWGRALDVHHDAR